MADYFSDETRGFVDDALAGAMLRLPWKALHREVWLIASIAAAINVSQKKPGNTLPEISNSYGHFEQPQLRKFETLDRRASLRLRRKATEPIEGLPPQLR